MNTVTHSTINLEGVFEQHENGAMMTTSADNYAWFAWRLAQLPFRFVIQSPDALKQALNEQIQQLQAAV